MIDPEFIHQIYIEPLCIPGLPDTLKRQQTPGLLELRSDPPTHSQLQRRSAGVKEPDLWSQVVLSSNTAIELCDWKTLKISLYI